MKGFIGSVSGRYDDVFRREPDGWRFAARSSSAPPPPTPPDLARQAASMRA